MAEISIDLLGPVRATVDGVERAVGGGKQRAVLAMLALQVNRMVSTDRLIEGLWAPDLPPSAGRMVHVYISRLRKALGRCAALIVTHGSGYELRMPGDAVDLVRFERLLAAGAARDALGLWRGPALANVAGEPFAAIEIGRLEELRLQATESAIEADIAGGRVGAAVAELDALVSEHPLREHLQALRLLALYRAGRQADALEHYRTVRQGLIDELGLEPGPELRDLHQAILTHDAASLPAQHVAPRQVVAAPPASDVATPPPPRKPRTRLIGRQAELAELQSLLAGPGLITIAGPGGSGKTRLAEEIARRDPGRTALIELAGVSDSGQIVAELAAHFHLRWTGEEDALDALAGELAARPALIVLDNCEHLRAAAAGLVDRLLDRVTEQRVLATSREPLAVAGERVWHIPPLSLQGGAESEAVALFCDRATLARAGALAGSSERDAVVAICRRLDGLPLAIELAAARAGSLAVSDLLVALDAAALDLLNSRSPSLPERHRSVRALIDWSHALLDPAEQEVLRRLAVFRGGFELGGAEAVCDAPAPHVALAGLVERSLVELVPGRYRLLETIRAYAGAKLADAGEAAATSRRHAEHYLAVVQRAERGLRRSDPKTLRFIATELDNLRAADAWARTSDHRLQAQLAAALGEFWSAARRPHEGLEWIEAALAPADRQPDPAVRAELLLARAQLVRVAGRASTARAEADARAALAVFEELGDDAGVARSLILLGWEAMGRDDRRLMVALGERALTLGRRLDDDLLMGLSLVVKILAQAHVSDVVEIARASAGHLRRAGAVRWLAHLLAIAGYRALVHADYEAADELFAEALEPARASDDAWTLDMALGNIGLAALFRERFDSAQAAFEQQLEIVEARPEWSRRLVIAEPMLGLAAIAAARGDREQAAMRLRSAQANPGWLHPDEVIVQRRLIRRFLTGVT